MKISPTIKNQKNSINFEYVDPGNVFLFVGAKGTGLWIKTDDNEEQSAINLGTGAVMIDNCDSAVVVVDATVTWKHIVKKGAKK